MKTIMTSDPASLNVDKKQTPIYMLDKHLHRHDLLIIFFIFTYPLFPFFFWLVLVNKITYNQVH